MIVKIHKTPNGPMLAVCDSDILGKVFEEGNRRLDLSSLFYQGKETSAEDFEKLLKGGYIVNAVGKDCVGILLRKGLVRKENLISVSGIPHAQCVIEG